MQNLISHNRTEKRHLQIRRRRKLKRMTARFITVLTALLFVFTIAGSIRSFAGSENSRSGLSKQYTSVMVYPGDSLDSVADKYLCPEQSDRDRLIREIASINHLSPENPLTTGNHIIVPVYR